MDLLVNIDVDDLERGIAFYRDALGLKVGRRFGELGAEMLGASSAIFLLARAAGTQASPTMSQERSYSRHWTPVHLDIVVEDIEAAEAHARAAGATLEVPIQTRRWGRIAQMADPFGHGFCLIQFLDRGYDEIL